MIDPHVRIPALLLTIVGLAMAVPVAAQAAGSANVNLSEWSLAIRGQDAGPGTIAFEVRNTGSYTHAFEIEHNGDEVVRTDNISPGSSTRVTVDLAPGTYELYCSIDGHRASGMDARIQVGTNGLQVMQGNSGSSGGGGYSC